MKFVYMVILGIILCGCGRSSSNKTAIAWRNDPEPIVLRFPILKDSAAFIWRGELAGQSSCMSTPGPSAYRISCFVEKLSFAISNRIDVSDLQPIVFPTDVAFPDSVKSASTADWFSSEAIDKNLFNLKYQGKAFYAPTFDLLYFDALWE